MRNAGVKRGGIQGIQNDRVTIEVQGTVNMGFPIEPISGEWNMIIDIANEMMELNFKQLEKLEKIKW